jgi:Zn/Cd-binding protein ZinT
MEMLMKKTNFHRFLANVLSLSFFVFVLLAIGCSDGSSNDDPENEPELTKWNGTWNSMTNYLDADWLQQTFEAGATGQMNGAALKAMFVQMMTTSFKSCVISGDTFTMYTGADASGTATPITYTFKQTFEAGEEDGEKLYWYAFEGNQNGDHKYLIALPPERHSSATAEHFHFRYGSEGFQALLDNENWYATLAKQGTTNEQIKQSLADVIAGMFGGALWLDGLKNPFIGEWKSDPDEDGIILTFTGKSDGTFQYTMQNLPEGAPYPSNGNGSYIIREDKVIVSYFDFGLIKSNIFRVIDNNTVEMTELTLVNGEKITGNATNFHRQGSPESTEDVPIVLPNNIIIRKKWNAAIPEPEDPDFSGYPTTWEFDNNGTVICTFIGMGEVLGFSTEDAPYYFSYVIFGDKLVLYAESSDGSEIRVYKFESKNSGSVIEVTRLVLASGGLFVTDQADGASFNFTDSVQ